MAIFLQYLATWDFHLRMLALVLPAAAAGLVALWAAKNRRHWFWGALAIWASVMALLPIRAYEPAFVLMLSLPLIVLLVNGGSWLAGATPRAAGDAPARGNQLTPRFPLSDLFLLILFAAIVLVGWMPISRHMLSLRVEGCTLTSMAIAAVTALAYGLVVGPWRLPSLLLLAGIIAGAAFAIPAFGRTGWENTWGVVGVQTQRLSLDDHATVGMALVELAIAVAVALGMGIASTRPQASPRARWLTRGCLVVLAVVAGIPLAWLYWQMTGVTPFPPDFAGGGNRYYELVALGQQVQTLGAVPPTPAARRQLHSLCDEAAELLAAPNFLPFTPRAHLESMQQEARSKRLEAFDINAFSKPYQTMLQEMTPLCELHKAIDGQARAAASAGDIERAARLAVAELRFGAMLMRGGLLDECLAGRQAQWDGQRMLARLRRDLSADQARAAISALDWIDSGREPPLVTIARDQAFMQRRWGWPQRLTQVLRGSPPFFGTDPYSEQFNQRTVVIGRLLKTDLAIRLFRSDRGQLPTTLDELVPGYLAAVALDPYRSAPLCYRPAGDEFLLYSVGHGGHDNGGRFSNLQTYNHDHNYDFDLDTLTRP